MDSCLRSPTLSQVYLSLTFQLSQTAVVEVGMSYTFPTVPVNLTNSQLEIFNEKFMCAVSRKEVGNCFVSVLATFATHFSLVCVCVSLFSLSLYSLPLLPLLPIFHLCVCVCLCLA